MGTKHKQSSHVMTLDGLKEKEKQEFENNMRQYINSIIGDSDVIKFLQEGLGKHKNSNAYKEAVQVIELSKTVMNCTNWGELQSGADALIEGIARLGGLLKAAAATIIELDRKLNNITRLYEDEKAKCQALEKEIIEMKKNNGKVTEKFIEQNNKKLKERLNTNLMKYQEFSKDTYYSINKNVLNWD